MPDVQALANLRFADGCEPNRHCAGFSGGRRMNRDSVLPPALHRFRCRRDTDGRREQDLGRWQLADPRDGACAAVARPRLAEDRKRRRCFRPHWMNSSVPCLPGRTRRIPESCTRTTSAVAALDAARRNLLRDAHADARCGDAPRPRQPGNDPQPARSPARQVGRFARRLLKEFNIELDGAGRRG